MKNKLAIKVDFLNLISNKYPINIKMAILDCINKTI